MAGIRRAVLEYSLLENLAIEHRPDRDFSVYFNIQRSAFSIAN
jgi:hypothetical protein